MSCHSAERSRLSDPAPPTHGMQVSRDRGVRCVHFVRRRDSHCLKSSPAKSSELSATVGDAAATRTYLRISNNLRPISSQAGNDVRTHQGTFELYPQNTQITRKKSASIRVFCGQKICPS